jgi:dimethylamine/trimethylamine dehydrogenase
VPIRRLTEDLAGRGRGVGAAGSAGRRSVVEIDGRYDHSVVGHPLADVVGSTPTGRHREIECDSAGVRDGTTPGRYVGTCTGRSIGEWGAAGLRSVRAAGDANCSGTIAAAVWEGRRYAEELEQSTEGSDETPFKREVTGLAPVDHRK